MLDRLEKPVASDAVCLLLARIANAANYAEEVQSNYSLLMVELLEDASEQVHSGQ